MPYRSLTAGRFFIAEEGFDNGKKSLFQAIVCANNYAISEFDSQLFRGAVTFRSVFL